MSAHAMYFDDISVIGTLVHPLHHTREASPTAYAVSSAFGLQRQATVTGKPDRLGEETDSRAR